MLGFRDSLNAWFIQGANQRAEKIWQQDMPAVSHPLELAFGADSRIRLVGIDCPVTRPRLNHYLRWRLVFRIDAPPGTEVDTAVDLQATFWRNGAQVPAEDLSFPTHLPPQEVPAGTLLVLPQRHQFRHTEVTPGPVELTLKLIRQANGRPLPVSGRASGLLRIELCR